MASEANTGVLDFLERMRKERDELIALVAGIEKRLGIQTGRETLEPEETRQNHPKVKVSIDSVPVGFFHNLSQPLAVEKLLKLNPGQPLATGDILDAFRKSGIEVNPKNAATILYTALKRNPKFERVAGKAWGLAEWYPEKRKASRESRESDHLGHDEMKEGSA